MSTAASRRRILEPPGRWSALRVSDLWHYRELLYILAWRDVKVRYKQAVLGVAWVVLQPLVMTGLFTLLFSIIAKVPTGEVPYAVFAIVGLVPWTMFSTSVPTSAASLVANQNLVSKVRFPRLVIPVSVVLARVPDFAIGVGIMLATMLILGFSPPLTALLLPLVLVAAILASLSVGIWTSALNVAYRDVQYLVPFLIQAWLFVTPVAYPTSVLPGAWRWLAALNPMSWVMDLARWVMLQTEPPLGIDAISLGVTVVLLVTGLSYFRRVEHFFADVI